MSASISAAEAEYDAETTDSGGVSRSPNWLVLNLPSSADTYLHTLRKVYYYADPRMLTQRLCESEYETNIPGTAERLLELIISDTMYRIGARYEELLRSYDTDVILQSHKAEALEKVTRLALRLLCEFYPRLLPIKQDAASERDSKEESRGDGGESDFGVVDYEQLAHYFNWTSDYNTDIQSVVCKLREIMLARVNPHTIPLPVLFKWAPRGFWSTEDQVMLAAIVPESSRKMFAKHLTATGVEESWNMVARLFPKKPRIVSKNRYIVIAEPDARESQQWKVVTQPIPVDVLLADRGELTKTYRVDRLVIQAIKEQLVQEKEYERRSAGPLKISTATPEDVAVAMWDLQPDIEHRPITIENPYAWQIANDSGEKEGRAASSTRKGSGSGSASSGSGGSDDGSGSSSSSDSADKVQLVKFSADPFFGLFSSLCYVLDECRKHKFPFNKFFLEAGFAEACRNVFFMHRMILKYHAFMYSQHVESAVDCTIGLEGFTNPKKRGAHIVNAFSRFLAFLLEHVPSIFDKKPKPVALVHVLLLQGASDMHLAVAQNFNGISRPPSYCVRIFISDATFNWVVAKPNLKKRLLVQDVQPNGDYEEFSRQVLKYASRLTKEYEKARQEGRVEDKAAAPERISRSSTTLTSRMRQMMKEFHIKRFDNQELALEHLTEINKLTQQAILSTERLYVGGIALSAIQTAVTATNITIDAMRQWKILLVRVEYAKDKFVHVYADIGSPIDTIAWSVAPLFLDVPLERLGVFVKRTDPVTRRSKKIRIKGELADTSATCKLSVFERLSRGEDIAEIYKEAETDATDEYKSKEATVARASSGGREGRKVYTDLTDLACVNLINEGVVVDLIGDEALERKEEEKKGAERKEAEKKEKEKEEKKEEKRAESLVDTRQKSIPPASERDQAKNSKRRHEGAGRGSRVPADENYRQWLLADGRRLCEQAKHILEQFANEAVDEVEDSVKRARKDLEKRAAYFANFF